jgi:hypothetical protein
MSDEMTIERLHSLPKDQLKKAMVAMLMFQTKESN